MDREAWWGAKELIEHSLVTKQQQHFLLHLIFKNLRIWYLFVHFLLE